MYPHIKCVSPRFARQTLKNHIFYIIIYPWRKMQTNMFHSFFILFIRLKKMLLFKTVFVQTFTFFLLLLLIDEILFTEITISIWISWKFMLWFEINVHKFAFDFLCVGEMKYSYALILQWPWMRQQWDNYFLSCVFLFACEAFTRTLFTIAEGRKNNCTVTMEIGQWLWLIKMLLLLGTTVISMRTFSFWLDRFKLTLKWKIKSSIPYFTFWCM